MQWFVVEICLRLFFSSIFPAIPGGRLICIRDINNFIYHCEHSRDFTDMETKSLVCSSPEINSAQKKKEKHTIFPFDSPNTCMCKIELHFLGFCSHQDMLRIMTVTDEVLKVKLILHCDSKNILMKQVEYKDK